MADVVVINKIDTAEPEGKMPYKVIKPAAMIESQKNLRQWDGWVNKVLKSKK